AAPAHPEETIPMFAFGISQLPSELFVYLLLPLMLLLGISLDTSNMSLAWRRPKFSFYRRHISCYSGQESNRMDADGCERFRLAWPAGRSHPLLQRPHLVTQHRVLQIVFVFGARTSNLGRGLIQLRLAQLDNGTESQVVARLRQVERLHGLMQ